MNCKLSMPSTCIRLVVLVGAASFLSFTGCTGASKENSPAAAGNRDHNDGHVSTQGNDDADIQAERAKLSPEDQRLVAAQEFCAISNDERLGAMGPPAKIVIKGQPVFLCCKGCEKKALANPEKTLAKVEELKAKVKAAEPK